MPFPLNDPLHHIFVKFSGVQLSCLTEAGETDARKCISGRFLSPPTLDSN